MTPNLNASLPKITKHGIVTKPPTVAGIKAVPKLVKTDTARLILTKLPVTLPVQLPAKAMIFQLLAIPVIKFAANVQ
jgi:hypothetical protein